MPPPGTRSPSENTICRTVCPPARIDPPKNRLLSISTCQRLYEKEIGRPDAAKYGLTLSDVKTPPGTRIMVAFFCETRPHVPGRGVIRGRCGPGWGVPDCGPGAGRYQTVGQGVGEMGGRGVGRRHNLFLPNVSV